MKSLYEKIISSVLAYYEQKKYGLLLVILLEILCILLAIGLLMYRLVFFVRDNYETIVFMLTILGLIIYWINTYRSKRSTIVKAKKQEIQLKMEQEQKAIAESNYGFVQQIIFQLLCELCSSLGIEKPITLSSIESPTHYYQISDVTYYQFLSNKTHEVDIVVIKEIMQKRINQKLNAMEFSGITQSCYFYEGVVYPSVLIDKVADMNTYIQFDVVITNEKYCKDLFIRNQLKYQDRKPNNININDKDF